MTYSHFTPVFIPRVLKRCVIGVFASIMILTGQNLMAVEEAKYTVLKQQDEFEIRQYAPSIVAEVVVEGEFTTASNKAFRKLFKFISGDNTRQGKIAMTAPVSQTAGSEKIAMTAPVGQQASPGGWVISFMMPASYSMETIPLPTDTDIRLREIPAYRAAAVQYPGTWSEKNYQKYLERLRDWVDRQQLITSGEPVWARYNAPFTPWFMRRNEILIPVKSD